MRLIKAKLVKIRAEHQCCACLRWFLPGLEMEVKTIDNDGICTIYICETCQELLSEFKDSFINNDDEFDEGCVCEVMPEFDCNTPEELYDLFKKEEKGDTHA